MKAHFRGCSAQRRKVFVAAHRDKVDVVAVFSELNMTMKAGWDAMKVSRSLIASHNWPGSHPSSLLQVQQGIDCGQVCVHPLSIETMKFDASETSESNIPSPLSKGEYYWALISVFERYCAAAAIAKKTNKSEENPSWPAGCLHVETSRRTLAQASQASSRVLQDLTNRNFVSCGA